MRSGRTPTATAPSSVACWSAGSMSRRRSSSACSSRPRTRPRMWIEPPMPSQTSSATDLWEELAAGAADESHLWRDALLPRQKRQLLPVFSPLAPPLHALGVETIYEGYLV